MAVAFAFPEAVAFAIIAGVMTSGREKAMDEIAILTYVNLGFTGLAYVMSMIIPGLVMKVKAGNVDSNEVLLDQAMKKIQSGHMVRFGLVEGAALFGCVCVFIGQGYINYLSLIPLFMALVAHFPTKEELVRQFIVHIRQDERLIAEHLG